ncbi:hypothetical protein [Aquisalinus flavus]|uniref:Uncharacterized protein n=1 Tax=Aquisalinus flavus TaxID=1526572 RepID=A0A8J2V7R5_9PROT|nr:hypothetical protein [Aquisalinus flavus]MBD0425628.1 hypothetical protein [Aquisalinus flavus]UNE48754.1 hypothetical protein FF099_12185 [Aquisalinus flavus]GGD14514.1 hypothetical protein GCM10011342_24140 [Aquisalinus flavus]
MRLKALQLAGIGAVIIIGAQLVLSLIGDRDDEPPRLAADTALVVTTQQAGAAPAAAPGPDRRVVTSAIDYAALGLAGAEEAFYCEGIIMLGAADETGRISDDDRALVYTLSDYGNALTGAQGIDGDTAMVARQQSLLQAQYDLEDGLTVRDVEACREMARNAAR